MTNASLGGVGYSYNPYNSTGQQGVAGGIGPCNIGLLVRTTGLVTSVSASGFTMTDGSGADVRVTAPSSGIPSVGAYVAVTAPCSCFISADGSLLPVLDVRFSSDVQVMLP